MNWHARLAERRGATIAEGPGDSLPKLTEATFVGSVSDPDGLPEIIVNERSSVAMRAHLVRLSEAAGIAPGIVDALDDGDVLACDGLSDSELTAWLAHWSTCRDCGRAMRARLLSLADSAGIQSRLG